MHAFHQPPVLFAGLHDIDARCLDAGMAEQVRQLCNVFVDLIKGARKQMPQVVRENLLPRHPRPAAQRLHDLPHRHPAQRPPRAGQKHRPGVDAALPAPFLQAAAQLRGQQDLPAFALAPDAGAAALHGLRRDIHKLRHADAGGADGLQQQQRAGVAAVPRGGQQAEVFGAGQLAVRVAEHPPLPLERLRLARRIANALLVVVHRRQHRVDRGRGIPPRRQAVPPCGDGLLAGGRLRRTLCKKARQRPGILLDRRGAVLPPPQPGPIARQNLVFVHTVLLSCCFLLPFIMPYLQQLIYQPSATTQKKHATAVKGAAVACFFQRYFPVEMQAGPAGLRTAPKTPAGIAFAGRVCYTK